MWQYTAISGLKMRAMAVFLGLTGLWLLMSGVYTPFVVGLGVGSALLVVFIVFRMNAVDGDRVEFELSLLPFIQYLAWLLVEIFRANWAVTKVILSPRIDAKQHLFTVPALQKSDLAQVTFANSITLTPGTITVETEPGRFLVHALDFNDSTRQEVAEMGRRIAVAEKQGDR